ncbi:hypothetical protein TSMEX_001826 [Taenia solium]|eukprot:TsM_000133400 transcript=TsM_000133400 gene=TsM_000133400
MLVFIVATDLARSGSSQAVLRELQHRSNYLTALVQCTSVVLVTILRYCTPNLPFLTWLMKSPGRFYSSRTSTSLTDSYAGTHHTSNVKHCE